NSPAMHGQLVQPHVEKGPHRSDARRMGAGQLPRLWTEAAQEVVHPYGRAGERREHLVTQVLATGDGALGNPLGGWRPGDPERGEPWWGRGVPLEPAADRTRVEFRTDGKMDDHITDLPARTGTGGVPGRRRQGLQGACQLLRFSPSHLDTVLRNIHTCFLRVP